MIKIIFTTIIAIFFIGCGNTTPNIDINNYSHTIYTPINIPSACQTEYKNLLNPPTVAIMKFTNNSNFGVAKITNVNHAYNASAQLGVTPFGIGAGAHKHDNKNIVNRVVDPKLDKAIISSFEAVLTSMGGIKVYAREDLKKIINEQKLQQSGLFDSNTLVKLGKLAGVKYIITGSIDAINFESSDYSSLAKLTSLILLQSNTKTKNKLLGVAGVNLASKALSGTKVSTTITFKILDVTTAQILFSKQITQSTTINNGKNPTYSQLIGAVKYDIIHSLKKVKPDLYKFFAPKGYILQVKADKHFDNAIAQINLGYKDGIKAGNIFKIYQFNSFIDPITHKTLCDTSFMDVNLIISKNQLQDHRAWGTLNGNDIKKVRPGNIIKRVK